MRLLAIETSCDETAAAVVDDGRRVLSNVVASQVDLHRRYGGVVPELAARQHMLTILPVIDAALSDAGLGLPTIDAVAATVGPGLSGALLVGLNAAKGLALTRNLPLIGVNHVEGHIYSAWLNAASDGEPLSAAPEFPLVCLVVSGGHTDLLAMHAHGQYRRLGGTLDDAAGEAFDKAARLLGLSYPGGPAIERAASTGRPTAFRLPRSRLGDSWDFSFSGLKTALLRLTEPFREADERHEAVTGEPFPLHVPARLRPTAPIADLAASFQAAVVDVLVEKTAAAAAAVGARCVIVAGGVAANALLRQQLAAAVAVPTITPLLAYCTDNAAMIGAAGYFQWQRQPAEHRSAFALDALPSLALPLMDAPAAPVAQA